MARKRHGRGRRAALVPLKFTISVNLSTLAANAAILADTVAGLLQDFDVVSTDLTAVLRNHTAGEGPIDFGLNAQQYDAAEVVEALDASPLSQYGTAQERSNRRVRHYGTFSGSQTEEEVNDGEPIRRKMFLRAVGGTSTPVAQVWIRNLSGATLTTGSSVSVQGTHWGRWK